MTGFRLFLFLLALILPAGASAAPTAADARKFIENAEARLLEAGIAAERAAWVQANFITDDTEALAAEAEKELIAVTMDLAKQARAYEKLTLPPDVARKYMLLKVALSLVAPSDPAKQKELTQIAAWMEGTYGKGKYCPKGKKECLDIGKLSKILAQSRNPAELAEAWRGWHAISPPMKGKYARFVELANEGARELGFADLGALWRSGYDMPPDAFTADVDRLWNQVKPLYVPLHCYVRKRLRETYGEAVVPKGKPIPAHLLGNMWAQEWSNVYDLVKPAEGAAGYDVTKLLEAKKLDSKGMVRYGERFFTSLGFPPLPATFWERSLFTKPKDREVVCHASAWNLDWVDDLRIKMCIEVNEEDFTTIHHELGHNFYQRAYNRQPPLFRDSANDGFHEGIGDTVALSVTPGYLVKIGLLDRVPPKGQEIGELLRSALDKIAFLPFGVTIDKWRWDVFSGKVRPGEYNKAWWDLKLAYQGIVPPVKRTEADFDAGAKYHVPANTPYTRYFLARILQFQFHRALCREAGHTGPLSECSIYGNRKAGAKLIRMLEMGRSKPWPEALAVLGEKDIDATAILDYYRPLMGWLEKQNRGEQCGW
jgi:peptidyl-dipeptidase A